MSELRDQGTDLRSEAAAPPNEWTRKERHRIAALDRRARFLEARDGGDWDEGEAAAIRWALATLDGYRLVSAVPVTDGLDEAVLAAAVEAWWAPIEEHLSGPGTYTVRLDPAEAAVALAAHYRRLKAEGSGPQTGSTSEPSR